MYYHLEQARIHYKQPDNLKNYLSHLASLLSLQLKAEASLRSDCFDSEDWSDRVTAPL